MRITRQQIRHQLIKLILESQDDLPEVVNNSQLNYDEIKEGMTVNGDILTVSGKLSRALKNILNEDKFRDSGGALWEDMSIILLREGKIEGSAAGKNYANLNADMEAFRELAGTINDSPGADIVDLNAWNNSSACIQIKDQQLAMTTIPVPARSNLSENVGRGVLTGKEITIKASLLSAKSSAATGSFQTGMLACLKLAGLAIQKHKVKSLTDPSLDLIPSGTGLSEYAEKMSEGLNPGDEIKLHLGYMGLKYKPVLVDAETKERLQKQKITIPTVTGNKTIAGRAVPTDRNNFGKFIKAFYPDAILSDLAAALNTSASTANLCDAWGKFPLYAYLKTLQNFVTSSALKRTGTSQPMTSISELIAYSKMNESRNVQKAVELFKKYIDLATPPDTTSYSNNGQNPLIDMIQHLRTIDVNDFLNMSAFISGQEANKFKIQNEEVEAPLITGNVAIIDNFVINYASDESNIMRIKRSDNDLAPLLISWNSPIVATTTDTSVTFQGHTWQGREPSGETDIVTKASDFIGGSNTKFSVEFDQNLSVPVGVAPGDGKKIQPIIDGLSYQVNFELFDQLNFDFDTQSGRVEEIEIDASEASPNPKASTAIVRKTLSSVANSGLIAGSGIGSIDDIRSYLRTVTSSGKLIIQTYFDFQARAGTDMNANARNQILLISTKIADTLEIVKSGAASADLIELTESVKALEEANKIILGPVDSAVKDLLQALLKFGKDQEAMYVLYSKIGDPTLAGSEGTHPDTRLGSAIRRHASSAGVPMPKDKRMDPIAAIAAYYGISRQDMVDILNALMAEAGLSGNITFQENAAAAASLVSLAMQLIVKLCILGVTQSVFSVIGSNEVVNVPELQLPVDKSIDVFASGESLTGLDDLGTPEDESMQEAIVYESIINDLMSIIK